MTRFTLLAAAFALAAPTAIAATTAYQATGPILEVTDSKIVIEKDKEKWEIARDKDTKVTGDLKKGGRATVHYRMSATSIEAKDAKPAAKDAKAKDAKAKDAKDKK